METEWYVRRGNGISGPVSVAQLRIAAQTGELKREDPIAQSDGKWVRADSLAGLFEADTETISKYGTLLWAIGIAVLGFSITTFYVIAWRGGAEQEVAKELGKVVGPAILIALFTWLWPKIDRSMRNRGPREKSRFESLRESVGNHTPDDEATSFLSDLGKDDRTVN